MRVIDLALKDLRQILRDKKTFLFMLLMPVVFTAFMGFALKAGNAETKPLEVVWMDMDGNSLASHELRRVVESSAGVVVVEQEGEPRSDLEEKIRKGQIAAVVVIPSGYSDLLLEGQPVSLEIILDSASQTGQTVQPVLQRAALQMLSAGKITNLLAKTPEQKNDMFEKAVSNWLALSNPVEVEKAFETESVLDNPYNQSSPGMMVMFAIFGLVSTSMVLVTERKSGSLDRLMTTAMPRASILLGHLLAMFVLVLLQQLVLAAGGQVFFGVNYLREPVAILLVSVGLALWVSALGLMIGVLAQGEDQVVLFAMVAMFIFSALGGTWFPLEVSGKTFATIGGVLPSAWAMTGFQNILVRGAGFNSVLPATAILILYAFGFFGLAVWRFRKAR